VKENLTKTNFVSVVVPDHEVIMTIEEAKKLLENGLQFIENFKNLPGVGDERWGFAIGITVHPSKECELCNFGVGPR